MKYGDAILKNPIPFIYDDRYYIREIALLSKNSKYYYMFEDMIKSADDITMNDDICCYKILFKMKLSIYLKYDTNSAIFYDIDGNKLTTYNYNTVNDFGYITLLNRFLPNEYRKRKILSFYA